MSLVSNIAYNNTNVNTLPENILINFYIPFHTTLAERPYSISEARRRRYSSEASMPIIMAEVERMPINHQLMPGMGSGAALTVNVPDRPPASMV